MRLAMRTVLTILTLAALCTGSGETQRQKLAADHLISHSLRSGGSIP
jgi:hypothetical protein